MVFLQIAWNNLLRNRRRTIVTLLCIMIGIAVMVFTNGFNDGMTRQWANSMINETGGHLQVKHKDFYKYGISDMEQIYFEDPEAIIAELKKNPSVTAVMPRVSLAGLVGKDENSSVFYGAMSDLTQIDAVLTEHGNGVIEGQPLSADDPDGVVIGRALAKTIDAHVGDELVLLSRSIYGDQSSALVHVRGILQNKNDPQAEQGLIVGGLSEQMRIDVFDIDEGVTELIVRLDDMDEVPQVVAALNEAFEARGEPWIAIPWYSDEGFTLLSGIFNVIRIAVMIVMAMIVSFIISSAMMMAIYERIREVGSMRAIGLEKLQVYKLLYLEYALLTSLGGALGILTGCLLITIGSVTGVSISSGVFEGVRPVIEMSNLLISFLVPLTVAAIVSFFPIRSSCRMSVVDSLNYT